MGQALHGGGEGRTGWARMGKDGRSYNKPVSVGESSFNLLLLMGIALSCLVSFSEIQSHMFM